MVSEPAPVAVKIEASQVWGAEPALVFGKAIGVPLMHGFSKAPTTSTAQSGTNGKMVFSTQSQTHLTGIPVGALIPVADNTVVDREQPVVVNGITGPSRPPMNLTSLTFMRKTA